ncbi:MAG: hypothetical protein CM1200mP29_06320 [Verrucomicrobiota bacterium]|nr:MAG: hypothetical protein CM1200mP29_06320 [Verrucomicrobiota bacterium]
MTAEIVKQVRADIGPHASPEKIQFPPGPTQDAQRKNNARILRKIAEGDTENLGEPVHGPDPTVVESLVAGDRITGAWPSDRIVMWKTWHKLFCLPGFPFLGLAAFLLQLGGFGRSPRCATWSAHPQSGYFDHHRRSNLSGTSQAQRGRPLTPFHRKPCIYFIIKRNAKKNTPTQMATRETRWVTVEEYDRQVSEFLLADSSGKATVDTDNADFSVPSETIIGRLPLYRGPV